MTVKISEKNTKNEILEAYQGLLKKVQETKDESHQEIQRQQHNEEIIVRAAQFDTDQIVTTLGQTKVMITQSIGVLEKKLTEEYNRLSDLQQAIKIESKNLEELHQIKKNADSLAALLLAQKTLKIEFEGEIETKRAQWRLEKEQHDQEKIEHNVLVKKDRTRDEEEYRYKINLERKKDQDAYETRKNILERDLAAKKEIFEKECIEREAVLTNDEDEVLNLRTRVAAFAKELEDAIISAKNETTESLEREYRYTASLKNSEIEGEKRLQQQTIKSLQEKIKEQELLIRDLTVRAEHATSQVQTIALKALEGATGTARNERGEDNKPVTRQ